MATVTIYGDASDGRITGDNGLVYSSARANPGAVNTTAATATIGQDLDTGGQYLLNVAFLAFDTSTVGAVTAAALSVTSSLDISDIDFTVEARLHDWGTTLTTADWVAGDDVGAKTLLATLATSGWTLGPYMTFTETGTALRDNINTTGFTRILAVSDRFRTGTAPASSSTEEAVNVRLGDAVGTTQDPTLVITYLGASTDDILNPDMDVAVGSWTTDTGATTDLYAAIDELTASDTDYIQSPAGPTTAEYYETALETHADPVSSTGHIVHYRYQKNVAGGDVGLTAELHQGLAGSEALTTNQQGLETDTTGWIAQINSTIARSTSQAHSGVASLEVTATNTFTPAVGTTQGTGGVPVTPGTLVAFSAWIRAATAPKSCTLQSWWFNSGGTSIGSPIIDTQTDTTSGWTQLSATALAPATAAFAAIRIVWATGSAGEIHYVDDASLALLSQPIASWTHTNIPNTWTQQDQTLSGAQADSITDYSDLRLRFTPDMVTSDQTVPVPTKVADRASHLHAGDQIPAVTFDHGLTGLTIGNHLIIRSAADNSGGGGAARTFTITNVTGTPLDIAGIQYFQQNNDPGAASAGTTCNVAIAEITATSGMIRLTYSGTVIECSVSEEWSGINSDTPIVGTPVGATQVASTNMASLAEASIALGNVAYAAMAIEGPSTDTYTQDADTTSGTWVGLTRISSEQAADSAQTIYGGYKTVSAAGAQTYDPTNNTARDSAGIILELGAAPAPAPTIKTQVSWANLELPEGEVFLAHSAGINLGENWPISGPISAGATDS